MQLVRYTPLNEKKIDEGLKRGDKAVVFEAQESVVVNKKNIATRNVIVKKFIDCDQEIKANIAREVQAMARAKELTPYVPSFINLIEQNNTIDLVIEKIEGKELEEFISSDDLDIDNRIRLFVKILRVIEPIHNIGLFHRDLKPQNIIIFTNNKNRYNNIFDLQPYLIDFGSSFLLERYHIGTMFYKAPELDSKKHEHDITIKIDIYSLGIILYRLLTKLRVQDINPKNLDKIVIENYDQKKLETINNLISRMVDKEPNNRPATSEIITILNNITRWKK